MGDRLTDKVVLVTGGAQGIGAAAAGRMGAEGALLWVCDIDAARLAETAQALVEAGVEIVPTVGDVSDEIGRAHV